MKTVMIIKVLLLPLALLFGAMGMGYPGVGIIGGGLLAGAISLWRWRQGEITQLEMAVLAIFALAVPLHLLGSANLAAVITLAYAVLALMGFVSVLRGKPWTAEFSGKDYGDAAKTPLFHAINRAISLMWGVLFAALAMLQVSGAPRWMTGVVVVLGIATSIVGPRLLIRIGLRRMMNREAYDWPMPALRGAREGEACDVAVVGAGLGGLTAAALLAQAGAKVHVVEQHVLAGGYGHHWPRRANADGRKLIFRFDSGLHDFSGAHEGGTIRGLLHRLDAPAIDWLPLDHRYHINGTQFDVPHDVAAFEAKLGDLFPAQRAGLAGLFADIGTILSAMYSEAPGQSGVPGAPRTVEGMLAFPQRFPLAVQWMERPFIELVRAHVQDPALEAMLFALGGYISDNPYAAPVKRMAPIFGYYFNGGAYPRGGSGVVAQALVSVIERHGGRVDLGTPVKRIRVEGGRAAGLDLVRGAPINAGTIVSNADFKATMLGLVGREHLPAAYSERVAALRPACSAMMVHLGLRGPLEGPAVVHISGGTEGVGYVSPSRVDASAAPDGYSTLELMRLVPQPQAQEWLAAGAGDLKAYRRSAAYLARKAAIAEDMLARVRQVMPDLDQRIVCRVEASPVTFHRYDLASDGSIYGMEGFQSEPFKSPLPGLMIVGSANVGPGAEAVMIAGAHAAQLFVPDILDTRA